MGYFFHFFHGRGFGGLFWVDFEAFQVKPFKMFFASPPFRAHGLIPQMPEKRFCFQPIKCIAVGLRVGSWVCGAVLGGFLWCFRCVFVYLLLCLDSRVHGLLFGCLIDFLIWVVTDC